MLEELQDLKGVWVELGKIWEQIDELREKPWLSVQPRKVGDHFYIDITPSLQIRQSLDGLLTQMKNFPARLKQYASYDFVQKLLKGYLKSNVLITELKSEALKVPFCFYSGIYCWR